MISLNFLIVILQGFILVSQTRGDCNTNIYIQNGVVRYGQNHYMILCNSGYLLDGPHYVYCVGNDWERPPPTCYEESPTDRGCDHNIYINHGTVVYAYRNYKVYCNQGYVIEGSDIVYCVRGKWEKSPPICSEADNAKTRNAAYYGDRQYYGSSAVNAPRELPSQTNDNPCNNVGGCQQICQNDNGRAKCRCRAGYELANDGKSCVELPGETDNHPGSQEPKLQRIEPVVHHTVAFVNKGNDPQTINDPCHNHQCDQLCRIEDGRAQCRCRRGYILNKDDQRSCDVNTGPPIHPSNPCEKNNGGCDHKCTLISSYRVFCSCHEGYYLHTDKKRCIAVDVPRPTSCSFNNGGCSHTCSMAGQRVICSCPYGYKLHTDRKSCLAVTPVPTISCHVNNGGCQHTCSMRGYNVECSCLPGYKLHTDRKSCVDINECLYEHLHTCQHICENTEGSYTCRCRPGYFIVGNKCEGCRKHSYWSTEKNGCVDCPPNSYTLSDGKTSVGDCFCRPGYSGSPVENTPCLDNDECSLDNFGCSHTCVNIPGGAFCSCPFGFEVDKDNKTCIDINECSIKNGGCEGFCINTNGGFICKCPPGFKQSNKDQYSCDDVDECSENNGGCHQLCVNYRGGHYCTCKKGYRLDGSLKNCTDISCPALPVPHFSKQRCKKNSQVLPEMDNYPSGTVCNFTCIAGFKEASGSRTMECLGNGTWEGSLVECKSQHCPPLKAPENGDVHPPSCETEGNKVKQKCTFTCRQGYKLSGVSVFGCRNNLSWDKPLNKTPVCQPEDIRASMECIRDINATLPLGESSQNVTIPEPVTNMDSYSVFPSDIVVGQPNEFKAGKTKVVFTASSPSSNRTAKCITVVHVIDEEPPVFLSCPRHILKENAKVDGEIVTWEEPEVIDNVGVESLTSSLEPNTTLIPGSYVVEYVARDAEGNTESCSFKIDVIRLSCDDLNDPIHGDASCMDWIYGRICQPVCQDGYMRDPSEPQLYSCGDSGKWEPSNKISDCLPFTEAVSSQCPDGKEFKIIEETDEEICLDCSSDAVWSPITRKCEKNTTTTTT